VDGFQVVTCTSKGLIGDGTLPFVKFDNISLAEEGIYTASFYAKGKGKIKVSFVQSLGASPCRCLANKVDGGQWAYCDPDTGVAEIEILGEPSNVYGLEESTVYTRHSVSWKLGSALTPYGDTNGETDMTKKNL
jgi:hypothetical protein